MDLGELDDETGVGCLFMGEGTGGGGGLGSESLTVWIRAGARGGGVISREWAAGLAGPGGCECGRVAFGVDLGPALARWELG